MIGIRDRYSAWLLADKALWRFADPTDMSMQGDSPEYEYLLHFESPQGGKMCKDHDNSTKGVSKCRLQMYVFVRSPRKAR